MARNTGGDRLTVEVTNCRLVISIGIDTLAFAAANCERFYDGESGDYTARVTDNREFAREVALALQHEKEDGTTPVHVLLDNAFEYVVGDGGNGIVVTPAKKPAKKGRKK